VAEVGAKKVPHHFPSCLAERVNIHSAAESGSDGLDGGGRDHGVHDDRVEKVDASDCVIWCSGGEAGYARVSKNKTK